MWWVFRGSVTVFILSFMAYGTLFYNAFPDFCLHTARSNIDKYYNNHLEESFFIWEPEFRTLLTKTDESWTLPKAFLLNICWFWWICTMIPTLCIIEIYKRFMMWRTDWLMFRFGFSQISREIDGFGKIPPNIHFIGLSRPIYRILKTAW